MQQMYFAAVHKDADSDFGASFPDLPGCVAAEKDWLTLAASAAEAAQFHIDGMLEDGAAPPAPRAPEAVLAEYCETPGFVSIMAVAVQLPDRVKRVNVTLPEDILARIDQVTTNRSGFLAEAAREKLATTR